MKMETLGFSPHLLSHLLFVCVIKVHERMGRVCLRYVLLVPGTIANKMWENKRE
jgi:hypothetical protein